MRKTTVTIDEDLLTEVRQILRTETLRETIRQAFLEVLRGHARRQEVAALSSMRGMDLADDAVMSGAWRS